MSLSSGRAQIERVTIRDDPSPGGSGSRLGRFLNSLNMLSTSEPPDSYDPTSPYVVEEVVERLAVLVLHYDQEPTIHRLADGGLLVRWASDRGDLDIEFDADGDVLAMITDRSDGVTTRRNGEWWTIGPEALHWLYQV